MTRGRLYLIVLLLTALLCFLWLDLGRWLQPEVLLRGRERLHEYVALQPWLASFAYLSVYVTLTALSLPGALVMTLAGGLMFGLIWGTVLVSFASSIGATLAFLVARFLLRDWIQGRYGEALHGVNQRVRAEGGLYLFTLRMVPLFPFFLINLLLGLTPMPLWQFYLVSQLGMLPATMVYVNAGSQLASLDDVPDLFAPSVLSAFVLLGLLPWLSRWLVRLLRRRRPPAVREASGR